MGLWSYWTRCKSCDRRLWPWSHFWYFRRERICLRCADMLEDARIWAEAKDLGRRQYRRWCRTTLEGALHLSRMAKREMGEVPEGGTCCENMKEMWSARDYMAVGYNVWTPDGFIDPHCPFCSEPLPESH